MLGWRVSRGALDRVADTVSFALSGAVVMGTAIVSTALSLDGREALSRILLVVAAGAWVVLGVLLVDRLVRRHTPARLGAGSPAALSGVAATAALGARLVPLGWTAVGAGLLVCALGLWCALLRPVLREWTTPVAGSGFMLTVSTETLAVLAAEVAARERATWLLAVASALFLLGLGCYVFVLAGFDVREVGYGRGDHWVAGGALAVCALAGGKIALAAKTLATLHAVAAVLRGLSLAVWGLGIAWLVVLVAVEVLRPRVRYDIRRWSTVFPLGMYAASGFTLGTVLHASAITTFARIWVWVAAAAWLAAFAALLDRTIRATRPHCPTRSQD